jgi:hypothetical protein
VKKLHKEMEEGIFSIARKVEEVLEPQQAQQLRDYVPCLIPPPGKMRIGQSGTAEGLMNHLERIRNLPDDAYAKHRSMILEKAVEKRKLHMPGFAEFNEEEERERIGVLLDNTRQMSDVEFALNKEAIAEEFKGEDRKKDRGDDVTRKIRSFLLDPIILKHL